MSLTSKDYHLVRIRIFALNFQEGFVIMENSSHVFVFHRTKLKNQEYETLDHLECDLNLMFENAKRYNVPNSAIYKRVLKLQQVMQVEFLGFAKLLNVLLK